MTKENIFKNFMEDPLLIEKGYISKDKIEKIKFIDQSGVKLIEVIKMAINGNVDGDSEGVISRKINQYLNK
ncbi:hypothetical protein [Sediminibacterium salmoneum]|uniref:hypothetical protein n=1 Tax=Sediminibacterium salmoneum TaxID=426421 RepID=UPI00047EACEE|nr:hypothetical protein [Sediminibacterium salmoneum]